MLVDSDIIKWVLAIIVGAMGWWLKNLDRRIAVLEETKIEQIARITTLEAHFLDILGRLSRIETKLDALAK